MIIPFLTWFLNQRLESREERLIIAAQILAFVQAEDILYQQLPDDLRNEERYIKFLQIAVLLKEFLEL